MGSVRKATLKRGVRGDHPSFTTMPPVCIRRASFGFAASRLFPIFVSQRRMAIKANVADLNALANVKLLGSIRVSMTLLFT